MLELSYFCKLYIPIIVIMETNNSSNRILNGAMMYGTAMGVFWILKFVLVPLIFTFPFTSLMFLGLTAAVPFLGYFFVRQYRNRYCLNGQIGFMQAWMFSLLMYTFAALLVSVAHYVFFRYIDGGSMLATYNSMLDELQNVTPEMNDLVTQYRQAVDLIAAMSPIELTIQLVLNNIFYGMMLSLPTAFIVSLKRGNQG